MTEQRKTATEVRLQLEEMRAAFYTHYSSAQAWHDELRQTLAAHWAPPIAHRGYELFGGQPTDYHVEVAPAPAPPPDYTTFSACMHTIRPSDGRPFLFR